MDGQTISITKLKQDKVFVCNELAKWKESNINLEVEIKKLYHEMEMAVQEKDEVIENLQSKNEELLRYIDLLEKSEKMQHQGKDIFCKPLGRNCLMVCKIFWTGIRKHDR